MPGKRPSAGAHYRGQQKPTADSRRSKPTAGINFPSSGFSEKRSGRLRPKASPDCDCQAFQLQFLWLAEVSEIALFAHLGALLVVVQGFVRYIEMEDGLKLAAALSFSGVIS